MNEWFNQSIIVADNEKIQRNKCFTVHPERRTFQSVTNSSHREILLCWTSRSFCEAAFTIYNTTTTSTTVLLSTIVPTCPTHHIHFKCLCVLLVSFFSDLNQLASSRQRRRKVNYDQSISN